MDNFLSTRVPSAALEPSKETVSIVKEETKTEEKKDVAIVQKKTETKAGDKK